MILYLPVPSPTSRSTAPDLFSSERREPIVFARRLVADWSSSTFMSSLLAFPESIAALAATSWRAMTSLSLSFLSWTQTRGPSSVKRM